MAKTCPTCSADNRDDAQFCNACGTSLAVAPVAGEPCRDCGHLNAPGTRYCGSCGLSLLGSVVVPRPRIPAPGAAPGPDSTSGYFLHSAPAPFGAPSTQHGDEYDTLPPPLADAGAAEPAQRPPAAAGPVAAPAPEPQPEWVSDPLEPVARAGTPPMVWVGAAIAVLLLGAGAWWMMGSDTPAPTAQPAQPAIQIPAPEPAPPPAAQAPAPVSPPAPAPIEAPVATPAQPPAAPAPTAENPFNATPAAAAPPPAAAPPAPTAAAPVPPAAPPVPAAQPDAQRAAREKAAKLKAETEARAKAVLQQREQEAARARAEQDAAARRTPEAPRPAPAAAPAAPAPVAAPAPPPAPGQTAQAKCADRNLIARPLCEARECAKPEHAAEALCQGIREREERRRALGQ